MRRNGEDTTVVIGGGVVGCALARELAVLGEPVTLLEAGQPGRQASWAAAGMLAPLGEAPEPGPFLEIARSSRDRFPSLLRELEAETGIAVPHLTSGKLMVAWDAGGLEALRARMVWSAALEGGIALLEGEALQQTEPLLSPEVKGALRIPGDHQVENRLLSQALWEAARVRGVDVRAGARVESVESRHGAVAAVRLAGGERFAAKRVVVAAGCWSGAIQGIPSPPPVRPVKGQMLSLDVSKIDPPRHILASPGVYLVPRGDGRLLVGATLEEAGFDVALTPEGISGLLEEAIRLLPVTARLPILEFWTGLRPGTPDGLPILGPDPDLSGLWHATGHFRNGILLAPESARALALAMTERHPPVDLHPFRPHRFAVQ